MQCLLVSVAVCVCVYVLCAAAVPGISVALRVLAAPVYCLTLIQPHAVLFYTAAHTLTCAALQSLPPPSIVTTARHTGASSELDVPLLMSLGQHYAAEPHTAARAHAAIVCYKRAVRELQVQVAAAQASQGTPVAGAEDPQTESQGTAQKVVAVVTAGGGNSQSLAADPGEDLDEMVPAGVDRGLLTTVEMLAETQTALDALEDRVKDVV
jgi:hypothetical protein